MLITRRLTVAERARNAAVMAFVGLAMIGPWALRNHIVHGNWIPVKGSTWVNIWKGNNDFATGTDRLRLTAAEEARIKKLIASGQSGERLDTNHQYDMLDLSQKAALTFRPEAYREEVFKQYALTWIKAHKRRYVELCGIRLAKTLTVDWDNPQSLYKSYVVARTSVLLMSVLGLVVAWRQRWSLLFPAIVAGCALFTYTVTITAARFAFPFEPLQLILGAGVVTGVVGWATALVRRRPERQGYTPTMVAVAR